jgi:hypothetical protein
MNPEYVRKLKTELQFEWKGLHEKFVEVEDLRYLEDRPALRAEERPSGLEAHVGLTAELVENIKSALTSNQPVPHIIAGVKTNQGRSNSSKRELFWGEWLKELNQPTRVLTRLVDAQAMGLGVLKAAYTPWPKAERRKASKESRDEYLERQDALKRSWGPPLSVIDIHPLTFFPAMGMNDQPEEILEISWKSRNQVYTALGWDDRDPKHIDADAISGSGGYPSGDVRSLPASLDSSRMVEVMEYLNYKKSLYQIYIEPLGSGPVFETDIMPVEYFMALGRTTSSRDPDKLSLSVAEFLRVNEPMINRTVTRMFEAADLIVQKRLALALGEGSLDEFDQTAESDNEPERTTIPLKAGELTAISPGSAIIDPFKGAEHVYDAMPMIQLMLDLAGRHGVAPIFKGITSGAGSSGYKDNSLYLMAMSQFLYIVHAYQDCLTRLVRWGERQVILNIKQKVFMGDYELTPDDIRKFPALVSVNLDPFLPQSNLAEAQLLDQFHQRGHIPRRLLVEEGLKRGQPEELEDERMTEDMKELLKPILYRDALTEVGLMLPEQAGGGAQGLVDQNGSPLGGSNGSSPLGQTLAGAASGTRSRQPYQEPGTLGQT